MQATIKQDNAPTPSIFTNKTRLQILAQEVYHSETTLDEMAAHVGQDLGMLLELLSELEHDLRDLVREYMLKRYKYKLCGDRKTQIAALGNYTHNWQKSDVEEAALFEGSAANGKPGGEPSEAAVRAKERVWDRHARRALMQINGRELRDLSIGECRSLGKTRSLEARVLTDLGEQLGHLDHTQTVGAIMNDDQLEAIIKKAKSKK